MYCDQQSMSNLTNLRNFKNEGKLWKKVNISLAYKKFRSAVFAGMRSLYGCWLATLDNNNERVARFSQCSAKSENMK